MRTEQDAMMIVRAQLSERVATLRTSTGRRSARDFADNVDALKRLASQYGLTPVVRLAEALEHAGIEDGAACRRSLYLGRLDDAIGCARVEDEACEALLASVSVRFCA